MMHIKLVVFITIFSIQFGYCISHSDTIKIQNGSFEGIPTRGEFKSNFVKGWFDCGGINYPEESPPDIHPNNFWENDLPASDGSTYLGMVVRENGSYESVSQRLEKPLDPNKCYSMTLHLAQANKYMSYTRKNRDTLVNYNTPAVLRIWGGTGYCEERTLLAESTPIHSVSWQIYQFKLEPKSIIRSITFEAFYKTPVFLPYNGNILLDGVSDIIEIPCHMNEIAVNNTKTVPPHKKRSNIKDKEIPSNQKIPNNSPNTVNSEPKKTFKPKLLPGLNYDNITKNQTIELKNLYFKEDVATLDKGKIPVLDELNEFLSIHRDVVIEIGGHTNNVPEHKYCDSLSTARAKSVAEYLIANGANPKNIQFKGYGKKQPLQSNKTAFGRKRNQRVEIKIIQKET